MHKNPIDHVFERISATLGAWTRETTLAEMRAGFESLLAWTPEPAFEPFDANGVPAAWIGPAPEGPVLLYFHGGGYQAGSIRSHLGLMDAIARAGGIRVLGFNYRLAPEHRFPAALEDAVKVYRWLLDTGLDPAAIAFGGDSAGAGLALATLFAARDAALPLPAAAVFLSPWLDMEAKGESFTTRAELDPLTQRDKLLLMARTYLGRGGDPRNPLASPIHGELGGLPPTLIHVGDHETVLDDSRAFAAKAQAAGSQVDVVIWDQMIHHFQLFQELEESRHSIGQIAEFLNGHLKRPSIA